MSRLGNLSAEELDALNRERFEKQKRRLEKAYGCLLCGNKRAKKYFWWKGKPVCGKCAVSFYKAMRSQFRKSPRK